MHLEGLVGQEEPIFNGYCSRCQYCFAVNPQPNDPFGPHKTPEHLEYHSIVKHPETMWDESARKRELELKLGL